MQCWWRLRLVWELKEREWEREKGGGARERFSYSWGWTIVHNGQNGLNHRHMPNNSACVHVYLHLSSTALQILSLHLILRTELCICFKLWEAAPYVNLKYNINIANTLFNSMSLFTHQNLLHVTHFPWTMDVWWCSYTCLHQWRTYYHSTYSIQIRVLIKKITN